MTVRPEILQFFFRLLHRESGLVLDTSKTYLIETRLEPIAIQEGFASINALGGKLMLNDDALLRQKVVEAMTTNETSFFRDKAPFECLKEEILPELRKTRAAQKRIRIWCAACSTGQEPYSVAMMLCEMEQAFQGWDIEIVATDISESVLKHARRGLYSQHQAQRGLPMTYLLRYFEKKERGWKIQDRVKKFVSFQKNNLLSNLGAIGTMDVILCRNILIYFDQATKVGVLARITEMLPPKGFLIIGASETIFGMENRYSCIKSKGVVYYVKK